jgi:pyruvate dehydrogenase E1 component
MWSERVGPGNAGCRRRGSTSSSVSPRALCSYSSRPSAFRDRSLARACCRWGTLYDPFIKRGHDALNYACYQDARFILVATPSGITLAPEGGAHQSVGEPLTGLAQPGLTSFEPAYADELAILLRWAFEEIQRESGESVYFRLSTRPIAQLGRSIAPEPYRGDRRGRLLARRAGPGCRLGDRLLRRGGTRGARRASGAERRHPASRASGDHLARPSAPRLAGGARRRRNRGGGAAAGAAAALVTVGDFHPATLSWLGAVAGHTIVPFGVDRFGQSGDIPDLYRAYGIDTDAILDAAARACLLALH